MGIIVYGNNIIVPRVYDNSYNKYIVARINLILVAITSILLNVQITFLNSCNDH